MMSPEIIQSASASLTLRQGVMAAQAREFDRARELLQQATADAPDDLVAWYWLAIASPNADAAIGCLRRVLSLDPGHAPAREALSRLLVTEARAAAAAGRRDEARALATEATTLTPEATQPWRALADLATSQVERIDTLRRLLELSPGDTGLHTQLRQALLARAVMIANSDRVEARQRFREAAVLNPGDLRIWQALCNLADTREEQLYCLRELLRVAPDHQPGRSVLRKALIDDAQALSAAGQRETAHDRWREAVELSGDVETWLGFADTAPDEDAAARAIQAAHDADPSDPRAIEALDRLRGPQVDPSTIAAPDDAFSRFDAAEDAPVESSAGELDDSALDLLAQLPVPEPVPMPVHAARVTPAVERVVEDTPALVPAVEPAPVYEPAAPSAPVSEPVSEPAFNAIAVEPALNGAVVEAAPPAPAAPEPPAPGEAGTVMVVDDSPTIRKILGLTLERAGYRVIAAPDGQSALDRLRDIVPGVILLDIAMPDLDGYEVCKRIKADPRTSAVPVIMLSGKGAFFDKVKGHMAGATEYLTKPFETPAVLAVVTSHCQTEAHHG